MDASQVIDWSREAIRVALATGAPLLATALVVGLIVGVGQTLTQMHEPVVGQVPRLIVTAVVVLALLPWLIGRWVAFAGPLIDAIPRLIGGA
jgi:flagellar biosynthetic protein FliQ